MKLEAGDIAYAVEELSHIVKRLKLQEADYLRQGGADEFEKMVSRDQAARVKARRDALERVLSRLPSLPAGEGGV